MTNPLSLRERVRVRASPALAGMKDAVLGLHLIHKRELSDTFLNLYQSAGSTAILRASSLISSIRATSSSISLLETMPMN